jgi:SagB-type dehydrogenase family enzyme
MIDVDRTDLSEVRARLIGSRSLFSVSEIYHENSKITTSAPRIALSSESILVAPTGFKRYVYAERVELPAPEGKAELNVWSAIANRRSSRLYSSAALGLDAISTLIFYGQGVLEGHRRALPSAGGLYPLELYVIAFNVDGLAAGLYHYDPRSHGLSRLGIGDFRPVLTKTIFVEEAARTAAAAIVLTGMFGRSKIKYGERAYRFVLLEAGHAMQNICLAATALGLGICPVGGFIDDNMNDLLDVDGIEEAALYAATIGIEVSP